MCTGGNAECCAIADCSAACPDPAVDPAGNLDCFCTNDGTNCVEEQMPGTCLGDHPNGLEDYAGVVQCIIGDTCPTSCGG
jgi:hypothetical protein